MKNYQEQKIFDERYSYYKSLFSEIKSKKSTMMSDIKSRQSIPLQKDNSFNKQDKGSFSDVSSMIEELVKKKREQKQKLFRQENLLKQMNSKDSISEEIETNFGNFLKQKHIKQKSKEEIEFEKYKADQKKQLMIEKLEDKIQQQQTYKLETIEEIKKILIKKNCKIKNLENENKNKQQTIDWLQKQLNNRDKYIEQLIYDKEQRINYGSNDTQSFEKIENLNKIILNQQNKIKELSRNKEDLNDVLRDFIVNKFKNQFTQNVNQKRYIFYIFCNIDLIFLQCGYQD